MKFCRPVLANPDAKFSKAHRDRAGAAQRPSRRYPRIRRTIPDLYASSAQKRGLNVVAIAPGLRAGN